MSEVKKVISQTEKSAKAIVTSTAGLSKIVAELVGLVNNAEALGQDIENKQIQLDMITDDTKIALRKAKAELDLKVLENEEGVLNSLLSKRGLAHISRADVATLEQQIEIATQNNEDEVKKAVAIAEARLSSETEAAVSKLISEQAVTNADLSATNKALNAEIEFLKRNVQSLEATVKAEREARVQEAQARASASGVVINQGK